MGLKDGREKCRRGGRQWLPYRGRRGLTRPKACKSAEAFPFHAAHQEPERPHMEPHDVRSIRHQETPETEQVVVQFADAWVRVLVHMVYFTCPRDSVSGAPPREKEIPCVRSR